MRILATLITVSSAMLCLASVSNSSAKEIPLEQLLGSYSDGHTFDGTSSEPTLFLSKEQKLMVEIGHKVCTASAANGILALNTEEIIVKPDGTHVAVPVRFYIVYWGELIYLVKPDRMLGFINEINSGSEPRGLSTSKIPFPAGHNAYLKRGDWTKRITGNPDLPEEYRSYLHKSFNSSEG